MLNNVQVNTFAKTDVVVLLKHLLRLRQLSYGFVGQLTAAAFCIAGEVCRELQTVFFPCTCFLWAHEEQVHAQLLFLQLASSRML
jgi:hypothetical protein